MTGIDLGIIILYMVGIMSIGIYAGYRKNTTSKQFFLAGKSLPWYMVGSGLFVANISTIHLVGLAAGGFKDGVVIGNFEWMATFCLIILSLVFVPFYLKAELDTLPEFLEKRYNKTCRMILAGIAIFGALLVHIGISLFAGAKIFEYFFGIPIIYSVILIAVATAIYTVIGGLRAVMVTDTIQAVLLLFGCILLTTMAIMALPEHGIHSIAEFKAAVKPTQMSMLHSLKAPGTNKLNEYSMLSILLGYPILGIWYWCSDQTIVQKTLAAKDMRNAQLGAVFAGALKILPLFFMVLPGVIGYVIFKDKITDPNHTLQVMIQELLPTGLKGLFAAGLLAAVMSTVQSALNSTATVTAEDIVRHIRPDTEDKTLVLIGRITAVVVIILAILWSPYGDRFATIFEAINKIPMMFAPAVTTVFIFGVFWSRGTKQAAVATFVFGLVVGVAYFIVDLPVVSINSLFMADGSQRLIADIVGVPFMLAGFILFCMCTVVYVITSLMTPAPTKEELAAIHWEPPLKIITQTPYQGITDPRLISASLFAIMLVLYYVLR